MNTLREQQEGFARSIVRGVDKGYAQSIVGNGFDGVRRLGIYHHSVSIGLRDALGGVYGVIKKLVGEEFFIHVAGEYVRSNPSRTGNIHDYGENFPGYLKTFPGLEALPYLPDVARLEWAYHSAFHSSVGEVLNIESLSQVPESKYDQLILLLSPACFLLQSEYPLLHIWQANQDDYNGSDTVSLEEGGIDLAIVREGKQIAFHSLMPGAFAMLSAISDRKSFNESCEAALELEPDCDITKLLQDAVKNRIVIGFLVNE